MTRTRLLAQRGKNCLEATNSMRCLWQRPTSPLYRWKNSKGIAPDRREFVCLCLRALQYRIHPVLIWGPRSRGFCGIPMQCPRVSRERRHNPDHPGQYPYCEGARIHVAAQIAQRIYNPDKGLQQDGFQFEAREAQAKFGGKMCEYKDCPSPSLHERFSIPTYKKEDVHVSRSLSMQVEVASSLAQQPRML